jgi:TatA/E family protein of Tat protein translocase
MLAFLGSPGQLMLLSLVVLLLFGHKLPSTMRSLGQSMRAFREGMADSETTPRLEEES